jgi:adenosylhomocysteine nucleosidase
MAEGSKRQTEGRGVWVSFALKEEAAAFQRIARDKPETSVLITGIGRRNAEKSIHASLAGSSPTLILTCGFAGGLAPDLKIGDVIFSTDETKLGETLICLGATRVKFFCASRIATTAAEKGELRHTTGADAVEMESEVIQAICRERGIPCATVRVISDVAGEDLPLDFNVLAKADLNLDYGKLTWAIAKSPGKIPALLRLRKNTSFAAKRLAEALTKVIAPD